MDIIKTRSEVKTPYEGVTREDYNNLRDVVNDTGRYYMYDISFRDEWSNRNKVLWIGWVNTVWMDKEYANMYNILLSENLL